MVQTANKIILVSCKGSSKVESRQKKPCFVKIIDNVSLTSSTPMMNLCFERGCDWLIHINNEKYKEWLKILLRV